jgi:uncharacterized protein YraI
MIKEQAEGGAMKNQVLVSLSVTCIILAACSPQPDAAPPTEILPTAVADLSTSVPPTAAPTVTLIPLPQSQTGSQLQILNTIPAAGFTAPLASPNGAALNCREGPDTAWLVTTVLNIDQQVEITGRNADSTWLQVKNPSLPGSLCWIAAGYATITGDVNFVPLVAVPTSPVVYPTARPTVTYVSMGVKPHTIHLPGCVGPMPAVEVWAKIGTNGPMEIKLHFEDALVGNLSIHGRTFTSADVQGVSETFTPKIVAGEHRIRLYIDGVDLSGLGAVASYEIDCN